MTHEVLIIWVSKFRKHYSKWMTKSWSTSKTVFKAKQENIINSSWKKICSKSMQKMCNMRRSISKLKENWQKQIRSAPKKRNSSVNRKINLSMRRSTITSTYFSWTKQIAKTLGFRYQMLNKSFSMDTLTRIVRGLIQSQTIFRNNSRLSWLSIKTAG